MTREHIDMGREDMKREDMKNEDMKIWVLTSY
jgi:hypothetical protein